jgi:hypothetical protein
MGRNHADIPAHDLDASQFAGKRTIGIENKSFWANTNPDFLISYACYLGYYNFNLAAWLCVPPILVCLWATALIPAIHSRFGCTVWQLIRNVWFFMVAHPLRTLGVTILTWLPMVLLVSGFLAQDIFGFMAMAPIWITLYFGTAWAFNYSFLKKPFNVLIDHFNEKNAPAEDENALPEAEPIFRDDN